MLLVKVDKIDEPCKSCDGTYESLAASITQTVGAATPTMILTGLAGAGGLVTYDVTVSGPPVAGVPVPTGTVSVNDSNGQTCTIATLDSNGSGSCQITDSASFTVGASFTTGDGNYSSTTASLTPTVVVVDNSPVSAGNSLTFTATVVGPGAALKPTGSITWTLTGPDSPSCSISALSINGTATCTISGAKVGSYGATAAYGSDGDLRSRFRLGHDSDGRSCCSHHHSFEWFVHLWRDAPEYHSELFRLREWRHPSGPHHSALLFNDRRKF